MSATGSFVVSLVSISQHYIGFYIYIYIYTVPAVVDYNKNEQPRNEQAISAYNRQVLEMGYRKSLAWFLGSRPCSGTFQFLCFL